MRVYWIFLFAFFISFQSLAQFEIGPKIGFQTFKTVFNYGPDKDIYKSKFRVGYKFGGLIKVDLKPSFDLITDLTYARRGRSIEIRESRLRNIGKYNYIESSMMLRYKFEKMQYEGINYRLFAGLGPNFGYWINGKGEFGSKNGPTKEYKVVFGPDPINTETMNLVNTNRAQWGLDIGVGAIIEVYGQQKLIVDLRFTLGHTFLGDENSASIPILGFEDNLEANYRIISFSVAYVFEIDVSQLKQGSSTLKKRKQR